MSDTEIQPEAFDGRLSPRIAIGAVHAIGLTVRGLIEERLRARGIQAPGPRDDRLFAQFNASWALALTFGLSEAYRDVFRDIDTIVREFEQTQGTQVHKGSLYFNAAIASLHQSDFDGALYYFHAADGEDAKTYGKNKGSLLADSPLFDVWVYEKLQPFYEDAHTQEIASIQLMLGRVPTHEEIKRGLRALPTALLSSVIVILIRCSVYRDYSITNEGTRVLYYKLLVDFCHAFEASLKEFCNRRNWGVASTLGAIAEQNLGRTQAGDLSKEIVALTKSQTQWKCKNVAALNELFLQHKALEEIAKAPAQVDSLARLFALVVAIRNQVAHDLDTTNVLYEDPEITRRVFRLLAFAVLPSLYL